MELMYKIKVGRFDLPGEYTNEQAAAVVCKLKNWFTNEIVLTPVKKEAVG